ncbi:cyclin N-terminal domain-containing protein 1 isoform 2-T3 [Mantella aurantiaca]
MNQLPFKTKRFSKMPCTIFGIAPIDILEDILASLADDNEQVLENLSVHTGCFKQPKVIELVFFLAEHWCQDSSTKYQAVELLDRFMILHIKQLYKSSTENRILMEITERWASAKANLCERFILYLVSCIQITSKMNFHYHIINNNVAIQFLRSAGYSYKKEDLFRSEMTVLKTLSFHINVQSPFTFVEMLLEVLGFGTFKQYHRNHSELNLRNMLCNSGPFHRIHCIVKTVRRVNIYSWSEEILAQTYLFSV